jgi:hypothetical protein
MGFLGAVDFTNLPGLTVELVAAGAVIVVVRLFLNHIKESREETKRTFEDIRSVIDRNTTALALNAETMNRVIEIVTHCRFKEKK